MLKTFWGPLISGNYCLAASPRMLLRKVGKTRLIAVQAVSLWNVHSSIQETKKHTLHEATVQHLLVS